MKDSEIRTRAKELAIRIFRMCDEIEFGKGRSVLINQIVRSSTSTAANIHEANYASSRADFINKLKISLKECYETEFWIDMLFSTNCIDETTANSLYQDYGILRRMLVKSINTAKENTRKW